VTVVTIQELRRERAEAVQAARGIQRRADGEERRPTASELQQINGFLDEAQTLDDQISTQERMEGLSAGSRIADQVETVDEGQVETVEEHVRSAAEDEEEIHQRDDGQDPYQVRWGGRGAEQFRDMSITEPREFIRRAATTEYNVAFYTYLRQRGFRTPHVDALDNVRTMVEGIDADGGFLAPTQLVGGILREAQVLEELKPRMDVIRSNARSLTYTKGTDAIVMGWVAELGTKPEDQSAFARMTLVPHVGAVVIWVSDELIEDETFGLQGYLQERVAEAKVLLEEEAFVSGSGSGRPWGILTRLNSEGSTPNRYTTQVANTFTADDVIRLPYTMKVQYRRRGVYILGTNAIRAVRLQRENTGGAGTGGYIWQPSLQAGEPDTLNGYPVIETTSVALNSAIATGNDVGIFGDLRRYRVFERLGLQVKRLEELRALTDEVGFRFRFRTGGDVMLNEAFRTIRVL
jgi:HK97 family phage major capsid protein